LQYGNRKKLYVLEFLKKFKIKSLLNFQNHKTEKKKKKKKKKKKNKKKKKKKKKKDSQKKSQRKN